MLAVMPESATGSFKRPARLKLFFGQEYTFDEAKFAAQSYLEELNRQQEKV